ncbi:MAG: 16S rRNA (guanine(527)-N(7))-methyltransferase RsmG [Lapillicoccus sp.]
MKHPDLLTPEVASAIFGDRLELAERYVALLADTGISHGLIGPREGPRLWERHVLGCAVYHPAFADGVTVADVGAGAGLPGIVLAIVRPDLDLVLVEPLHRRTVWLTSTISQLGLSNVVVHEGRAESLWGVRRFPAVTARAVARIGALAGWCLPLLEQDGRLAALKGASARAELAEDEALVRSAGGVRLEVVTFGVDILEVPTTAIIVDVESAPRVPTAPTSRSARPVPGGTSAKQSRRQGSPDQRTSRTPR